MTTRPPTRAHNYVPLVQALINALTPEMRDDVTSGRLRVHINHDNDCDALASPLRFCNCKPLVTLQAASMPTRVTAVSVESYDFPDDDERDGAKSS